VILADALRLTEIGAGLALMQASAEHLGGERRWLWLAGLRGVLAALLVSGVAPVIAALGLTVIAVGVLERCDGPYNGGSDRMALLVLCCVCLAHLAPGPRGAELAYGYLAAQLVLSYVISGWVKIVNADWRSGRALCDVFLFSAYPVSESLRALAVRPRLLRAAAWAVMGFELAMPLALLDRRVLVALLAIAGAFHLANACLFGLNRFLWIWLSAYPSLWWLQARVAA
jgi:hypothetical protein